MSYSNAQKLASVVTHWARPAISQIAADKLCNLPFMQDLQQGIISTGLVGANYKIQQELAPFLKNGIDAMVQPLLENYFARIPDGSIPQLAKGFVETAMEQPKFSILDGLIEFEQDDLLELADLLDKNLPVDKSERYQVIN